MSVRHDITADELLAAGFRQLHAGDDFNHEFIFTRNSVALDLSGATVRFTVKEDSIEPDAQAKLTFDSGTVADLEITDATGGKIVVKFKKADTENLEGLFQYDVQASLGGGAVITLARGKIEFLPNLTRTAP